IVGHLDVSNHSRCIRTEAPGQALMSAGAEQHPMRLDDVQIIPTSWCDLCFNPLPRQVRRVGQTGSLAAESVHSPPIVTALRGDTELAHRPGWHSCLRTRVE